MKKNYFVHDDEINLIAVFKIIWNGKLKIILITTISFLIGFGYNYQLPNTYLNSLIIGPSKNSAFKEYLKINKSINVIKVKEVNKINQIILDKFIHELMDYEEFIFVIKNISKLSIDKQEQTLREYKKLLEIVKSKDNSHFILNLNWDDTKEAKDILKNVLNFTVNNLEKFIYKELEDNLELKKNILLEKDAERIEYLLEQRLIAKELDISEPSIVIHGFYSRGYRAIDKEIEIIKNREYKNISNIKNEIDYLKKSSINWIDYNINFIEAKSLKNTKFILIISIILGLMVGVFYVIISGTLESQTVPRKNTN